MDGKKGSFYGKLFSLVAFALFSGATLFFAHGYRIDLNDKVVMKTSIIDIINEIDNVNVYFDDEFVTDVLPFQIKTILPGVYSLKVEKKDRISWERKIRVREDIVTIVSDVLLMPNNSKELVKDVFAFGLGANVWVGNNYLVGVEADGVFLYQLRDNGIWERFDLDLGDRTIVNLKLLADSRFVVSFEDNTYAYVDYGLNQYKFFTLPSGVWKVLVDARTKEVFYLKDGNLFKTFFKDLSSEKAFSAELSIQTDPGVLLFENVSDFELDYTGNIYFISGGMLYSSRYDAIIRRFLDSRPEMYTNIAFHFAEGDRGLLMARAGDESRYLFATFADGGLSLLAGDIKGGIYVNKNNEVLYSNDLGQIFVYNLWRWHKRFVVKPEREFSLLGWFDTDGHYLFLSGGKLIISDVYGANSWILSENSSAFAAFTFPEVFYFFEKGKDDESIEGSDSQKAGSGFGTVRMLMKDFVSG